MPIQDQRLRAIIEQSSTGGLPLSTAKAVHHYAYLLLAAHTLDDVTVFSMPNSMEDGRYIIAVSGKWGISFIMSNNGPDDMRLEKLPKSCLVKQKHPSSRRRPAKR